MLRVRTAAWLAVLACALVVPATASAISPERLMLKKVNAYRKSHGVPAVHFSSSLGDSARKYSRYMMRHGYFGHASHIRASHRFHMLGEIIEIHRGGAGVTRAFRAWVHSPPHRAVMLMRQFKLAGAGFASGRFHGYRDTIWTMHFGRR